MFTYINSNTMSIYYSNFMILKKKPETYKDKVM